MTQSEFKKFLDSIIENTPLEELVDPAIMQHVNRIHQEGEYALVNMAKMDELESMRVTMRALSKTMFLIGYDAGRSQSIIDSLMD